MKTITKIIYLAVALVAFAYFALMPKARAVSPPPDGGYPGFNTAEGQNALLHLSTGLGNTAVGWSSLSRNTDGSFNTALGVGTLLLNIGNQSTSEGVQNTAVGALALLSNTTGTQNTANGAFALFNNTTESFNTATGFQALFNNTGAGGHYNVATGYQALYSNTTGRRNVAEGNAALYSNTVGNFNVAVGDQALFSEASINPNGPGNAETAIGWGSMASLTTGGGNTALGHSALVNITSGYQNIILGYCAGQNLTTGNGNIYISDPGVSTESNTIRVGNVVAWTDIYGFTHAAHTATYVAGIANATVTGSPVYIDTTTGQLGLLGSSKRFKDGIESMGNASEALLSLRPVTFRYKKNIDPKSAPQFGLVAEEVEKVNPDLVARDAEGKVFTVRYDAVNAMLLNEFLKEHRTVQEQQKEIDNLKAELKEQRALIRKVSDKVELDKPATQTVLNNQ